MQHVIVSCTMLQEWPKQKIQKDQKQQLSNLISFLCEYDTMKIVWRALQIFAIMIFFLQKSSYMFADCIRDTWKSFPKLDLNFFSF